MDTLDFSLASFLADREARLLNQSTIRFYRTYVSTWLTFRESAPAGEDVVVTFRRWVATKRSTTGRAVLRAIHAYEMWIEAQTMELSWIHKCQKMRFDPTPVPQVLSEAEFTAILLQTKRATPSGRRDRVLLTVLWTTGARVGAIVGLHRDDVDLENRTLRVLTKGNVRAPIVLPDKTADLLGKWMEENPSPSHWLFPSLRHSSGHLQVTSVSQSFKHLAKLAGIGRRVWVHLLRHSFATRMLDRGVSLTSIQRQLCHTTPAMTLRYARTSLGRVEAELRAAAD